MALIDCIMKICIRRNEWQKEIA